MEHKLQAYSHCHVSDQPGESGMPAPEVCGAAGTVLRDRSRASTVAMPQVLTGLLLIGLLAGAPAAFANDDPAEPSRSTAAQVWGYAQGLTQNITQGVASWFGRGEASEPRRSETRRPEPDTSSVTLNPDLMLEAFPALSQGSSDDTLRMLDGSQEAGGAEFGFNTGQMARERDLSASYVWESPRFGQFILSTNAGYQSRNMDRLLESNPVLPRNGESTVTFANNMTGVMPDLQSSFTFTWQIGNHTATAVTTYADTLDNLSGLPAGQINMDQLNELVGQIGTLDLRYGYSVRTGRQSSASISVGVRNMFDRRGLSPATIGVSSRLTEPSRVAYGTIKYQF